VTNDSPGNGQDATLRDFVSGQKLFRRYTLKRTLGRGGMGIVWLARDEELERDVALKFLPELIIHDRAVLSDLKRETRRSLELTHKNIVRIHDFVHDETSGCISMEYVDGDTLSNLRADRPNKIFEPHELKEWVSQLCDALDYAHTHAKIVHRDLKPSNLMVNQRGDMKVTDFGIARSLSDSMSMLTMDRGKSGTLLYMSPQQLDGERGTQLDDVYSLGASVYELLTSKPPFYSGNVDRQIREKIPARMNDRRKELEIEGEPIDETWEEVVRQCLAKDPSRRPQAVGEVAKMLAVPSPKTRRAAGAREKSRRNLTGRLLWIAAALVAIGVGAFFFRDRATQWLARSTSTPSEAAVTPAPPQPAVASAGGVIVDTMPTGAMVTLGGIDAGKSPITFKNVPAGNHRMRITLEGYDTVERAVEVKESEFNDLGVISLARAKAIVDLTTTPAGAQVLQNGVAIGTTPLRRDDVTAGETIFVFVRDGYLPREVKASLIAKQPFKQEVTLAQAAPTYNGSIRVKSDANAPPRALTINLNSDLKSGTMTQGSKLGDFTVKFSGVWEGTELHAVTGDVVAQPVGIRWTPESFTLRFADDGKSANYECVAQGKTYVADLTPTAASAATGPRIASTYKGTIGATHMPLTFNFATDKKSGTMTQSSKSGDVTVKFSGVWEGAMLRAVTNDVVSKPAKVQWQPEAFTLRFDEDGKKGSYECSSEGKMYAAQLSPQ
jgi:hypothetical protein